MKRRNKWLILTAVVAVMGLFAIAGLNRGSQPQYFTAKVERGEIRDAVEATGTINAVTMVQVGSQVSGTIMKLNVDFNSRVQKGQVIAVIEPSLFEGALLQATADLENAKANLAAARANLDKAKATAVQMQADYDRTVLLWKQGVVSKQQLDLAKANNDAANATVKGADASVMQAQAEVNQKSAAVSVARTNLDHTIIHSPIDGIVVARNVDVGQTVAASLQAPTIFTIAQDLTQMLVYAKTDESDVGDIKVGRQVSFKVDAFPKETFQGVVRQVRMNATMIQNVVTYDTIIEFQNPDLKLFPGMTAYVTIPVATRENALKLPNAALRYRPPLSPEELRAVYKQHGIEAASGQNTGGDSAANADVSRSGGNGAQPRAPRANTAVVWKLHGDNTLEPVDVALGITDHSYTEVTKVLNGELQDGDSVVIRSVAPKTATPGAIRR